MKTIKSGYFFLFLTFLLSGCAHYQIHGTLDRKTPVEGEMTSYFFEGKSVVYIHTLDKKMFCHGVMRASHVPEWSISCDEMEGSIVMDCNNGRAMVTNWTANGCSQGYGAGYTDHGSLFEFVFFPSNKSMYCSPMLNN